MFDSTISTGDLLIMALIIAAGILIVFLIILLWNTTLLVKDVRTVVNNSSDDVADILENVKDITEDAKGITDSVASIPFLNKKKEGKGFLVSVVEMAIAIKGLFGGKSKKDKEESCDEDIETAAETVVEEEE